jgi:hypothetical protein
MDARPRGRSNHARVNMRVEIDVLIAGGSFAGLEAMLALRTLAGERGSVELWAPDPEFIYRPLAVSLPFGVSQVHRFPLSSIAERCGARYRRTALAAVAPFLAENIELATGERP